MSEEWFDVAYINFKEAVLWGRKTAGRDEYGCRIEEEVRLVLSDEQKRAIEDMNSKHRDEMQKLLRGFAE